MLRWSCDTEIRTTVAGSGTAFFRAWKRRNGRAVRLKLVPLRDGSAWNLVAVVPHKRLEFAAADYELLGLVRDYQIESFNGQPTEHAARREARRAEGYDVEADVETVSEAAASLAAFLKKAGR